MVPIELFDSNNSTWPLGPLLRVNPSGTCNKSINQSQRVKGLRSKLGATENGDAFVQGNSRTRASNQRSPFKAYQRAMQAYGLWGHSSTDALDPLIEPSWVMMWNPLHKVITSPKRNYNEPLDKQTLLDPWTPKETQSHFQFFMIMGELPKRTYKGFRAFLRFRGLGTSVESDQQNDNKIIPTYRWSKCFGIRVSSTRFPSNPLIIRVAFFLMVSCYKETPKYKGKKGTTGVPSLGTQGYLGFP